MSYGIFFSMHKTAFSPFLVNLTFGPPWGKCCFAVIWSNTHDVKTGPYTKAIILKYLEKQES